MLRTAFLFGGGISGAGHTCGALLGAVTALSAVYGRSGPEEAENPRARQLGGRLVRRFEELAAPHGGIRCQDIARVDWTDAAAVQQFRTDPGSRRQHCVQIVGDIAESLGVLLEEPAAA
jgi:C_GCAxxG_C_C family probable redox protein